SSPVERSRQTPQVKPRLRAEQRRNEHQARRRQRACLVDDFAERGSDVEKTDANAARTQEFGHCGTGICASENTAHAQAIEQPTEGTAAVGERQPLSGPALAR